MKINHSLFPQSHQPYKSATGRKYCYYQSSNIKIPPQNQHSTKQGGRLPAPGSLTTCHFCLTEKHNCPSPFQGHDKLQARNCSHLQHLCCELLSYAAKHISHRPIGGRTTSPTASGQCWSCSRATGSICSSSTGCRDSHTLTTNHFFLPMSPASRSQQMHSEPHLSIKNIQQ